MQNYAIFSIYRAFISFFFNNFAVKRLRKYVRSTIKIKNRFFILYCSRLFVPLQAEIDMIIKLMMNKRLFATILAGVVTLSGMSQISKTLSPYSQFALGVLADQSQSFNRGMGGLSQGLRGGTMVNMLNPASYSAVDSLTMIFDVGISGQITNFKEGGKKLNRKTADFDYAVALFRVMPKMGVSVGVVPFSNVGYSYTSKEPVDKSTITSTMAYTGSGGFSQAFLGLGYEPLKGLSVGANFSYFWGKYDKGVYITTSESSANTTTKTYGAKINSYKIDLGAQWQQTVSKHDVLTFGATVGIGHKLGGDAIMSVLTTNPLTSTSDTTTVTISDAFKLPMTFGVGASLVHNKSLTIGADYAYERWGSLSFPQSEETIDPLTNEKIYPYEMSSSVFRDRHKVTVGADWIPEPNMNVRSSFFKRIHYKLGASYATPYYYIKGQDGPRELILSAGFSIPIVNSWNNRSLLNISAQWVNSSSKDFIKENTFRINIGLTFNERWFAKWKVD